LSSVNLTLLRENILFSGFVMYRLLLTDEVGSFRVLNGVFR